MSSGCGDVLTLEDLKTAKKHQVFEAEVITGKQGGVADGADIDYATNQVTGQTQKTMPAILRDIGFTPVSWDFSTGGTLGVGDRDKVVYDPVSKTWYSYAGTLPVVVPAGFNPVGNADWTPQTDPDLRSDFEAFKSDLAAEGSDLVGYTAPVTGARLQTLTDRLSHNISVLDFSGVIGDGINDDTAGIQAAIDATPWGGVLSVPTPAAFYKLTASLTINKPITIIGNGGSTVSLSQMPCLKFPVGVDGFVLVPTANGYRFEWGITGVVIRDIMLEGVSTASSGWARYAITVDETVHGGVYHVRECSFENVHIRYFDHGIRLMGTVYLNNFFGVRALWCGAGVRIDRNSAGQGYSDQNRFFGCEFVLNQSGMILSTVGHAGSQTIHGCTISENTIQGIVFGYNVHASVNGCTIEANPVGLTVLIPTTVTNPASESIKTITGNWFLANDVAIKVLKSSTALTGGFAFPVLIDGNSFNQTTNEVLRVEAPTGAGEFDSRQFILGSGNSYSFLGETSGPIPDSRISAGWAGYNGFHEDGKITISTRSTGTAVTNVGFFIVPAGHQAYVKYNMLSIPTLATNGRDQTTCDIKFMNVNTPATPVVFHQNTGGRSGSFTVSRSQAGAGGLRLSIDTAAISSTHTAMAEIEVCII